jgi:putative ABC transport system substrate-binding protein
VKRRDFIAGLGGAAVVGPRVASGQQPTVLRVGSCSLRNPAIGFLEAFRLRMTELGYVVGQNLILDYVDLNGQADQYFVGTTQLVERKADVIIAFGPEDALKAAMTATNTIPIVMAAIDFDPFALGYVTNQARPTGNVTGIVLEQIELAAKRLQLVRDAFPAISKATVFWDRISRDQWRATRDNANRFGFDLFDVELDNYPYDYTRALAQVPADYRGFLFVTTSPLFARDRDRIVQFSLLNRLPSMFVFREYVDQGGLASYGPNRSVMSRRVADYVHRIARGARPVELPIERPNIFELVINQRTAKSLGLEFSQAMLLRADEVIE